MAGPDASQDLKAEDFPNICRICLGKENALKNIFAEVKGHLPVLAKILTCASIQISRGDGLPEHICSKCVSAVNRSYSLRLRAARADAQLHHIMDQLKKEDDDVKVKTDPTINFDVPVKVEIDDHNYAATHDPNYSEDEWEENDLKPLSLQKKPPKPRKESKEKVSLKKNSPKIPKEKKERVKQPLFVECTVCQEQVIRKKVKTHMMMHNGEKPHLCDTCGRSFAWKCALTTHKRLHTGEKPFVCKHCFMNFRSSSRLSEHMTLHSGKKAYVCEFCAMAFRTFGRLKRHKRIHTGEKPYVCEFCDRRFSESYNLKQHLRLHTGEKPPHACSLCKAAFVRKKALVEHLKGQHGVSSPIINININVQNNFVNSDAD